MYRGSGDTPKPLTLPTDDGIVVVTGAGMQKRDPDMERMVVPASVRVKLGVEASEGLVETFSLFSSSRRTATNAA